MSSKSNETILITGADGFIGHYVTRELAKNNRFGIHSFRGDIFSTNLDSYIGRLSPAPSHLIHLAWVTGAGYLDSRDNLLFTQKSLELYDAFYGYGGKRAVFIGTEQEYGRSDEPLSESSPLSPSSLYAECKAGLGKILTKSSEINGGGLVWCRLFFVYGAGEKPKRLMPSLIRGLLSGEEVNCSPGGLIRDYAYVKDVAGAICHCLFSDYSGAVNISGGRDTTIGEIAGAIKREVKPDGAVNFQPDPECEQPRRIRGDISLLNSLGWTHKYSLETGLLEEIEEMKMETPIEL